MLEEHSTPEYQDQLFGNYRLKSLLGRGGFAEVYLGEHVYLNTQAAIKVLLTRLAQEEQESFYAEARTVAHLRHEHIVRVLEFGLQDGNIPYLVMEYAPHGTLRERFPRGKPTPVEELLPALVQVASALQYAHNEHLIHRDIKPENMLLGPSGEVLLSDFGIALMIKGSRHLDTQDVAGTIAYMAPEQLLGRPTAASDQYALGVVVYEWLSGERPFRGSFTGVSTQHMLTPPPSMRARVPAISEEVERVVLTALAKDPLQRFANVQAFVDALQAASQGQSTQVYTPLIAQDQVRTHTQSSTQDLELVKTLKRPRARTVPRTLMIAVLALVVLLVAATILIYNITGHRSTPTTTVQQQMQQLYSSATRGEPQITDPLNTESALLWASGSNGCAFRGGALHAEKVPVSECVSLFSSSGDIVYQVEMTIVQGVSGGVIFHFNLLPRPTGGIYYFTLTTGGQFSLDSEEIVVQNKTFTATGEQSLLKLQYNAAIKKGRQRNLLTVITRGPHIYLYINRHFVGSVRDSTSLSGTIGMFNHSESGTTSSDVEFRNLQVWFP